MTTMQTRALCSVGRGAAVALVLVWLSAVLVPTSASAKASAGRYVVSGDAEVVTDTHTKLEWQRKVLAGKKTWADAKSYCDGLTLSGKSDWRLPWVRELSSIVDKKELSPSIDKDAFPGTPATWFWSASLRAGSSSDAWYVHFSSGYVINNGISFPGEVRCVRGG